MYPVYFFKTDTSGEKLFEEFYSSGDQINLDEYESLGVITNSFKCKKSKIENDIYKIESILNSKKYSKGDLIELLNKILPNFNHIETGKTLDQKM